MPPLTPVSIVPVNSPARYRCPTLPYGVASPASSISHEALDPEVRTEHHRYRLEAGHGIVPVGNERIARAAIDRRKA